MKSSSVNPSTDSKYWFTVSQAMNSTLSSNVIDRPRPLAPSSSFPSRHSPLPRDFGTVGLRAEGGWQKDGDRRRLGSGDLRCLTPPLSLSSCPHYRHDHRRRRHHCHCYHCHHHGHHHHHHCWTFRMKESIDNSLYSLLNFSGKETEASPQVSPPATPPPCPPNKINDTISDTLNNFIQC